MKDEGCDGPRRGSRSERALWSLLGGVAAAAVGAPFSVCSSVDPFAPEWWVAASVTVGVLLATGSMVLNQVLIAQGSENLSLAVWVVAIAVAAVTMGIVSGTPTARVVSAFVFGEAVALLGLTLGARHPSIAARLRGWRATVRGS